MPYIMKNGTAYAGNAVTLTQAQYDALSNAEKHNGTVYYIYDSDNVITTDDVEYDNGSSKMPLSQVIYWIFVGQQETNNNVNSLSSRVTNITLREQAVNLSFTSGDATSDLGNNVLVTGAYTLNAAHHIQHYYSNNDGKWHFNMFYFSNTTTARLVNDGNYTLVVQYIVLA